MNRKITIQFLAAVFSLIFVSGLHGQTMARQDSTELSQIKNASSLDPFFENLRRLESAREGKVNIVHIGDSHVQSDFLARAIRQPLQQHFGNGGRGFIFPYRMRGDEQGAPHAFISDVGWQICRNNQPYRCDSGVEFGLAGYGFSTTADQFLVELRIAHQQHKFNTIKIVSTATPSIFRLATADGKPVSQTLSTIVVEHVVDSMETMDDIARHYNVTATNIMRESRIASLEISEGDTLRIPITVRETGVDTSRFHWVEFQRQERFVASYRHETLLSSIYLFPAGQQARYNLNGIILENDAPGVIFHNIGTVGSHASHFNATPLFFEQLPVLSPDLFIVSFGTNESFAEIPAEMFIGQMDTLIQNIRKTNPGVPILVTTPPTSLARGEVNEFVFKYAELLMQKKDVALWDLYTFTGGPEGAKQPAKIHITADNIHYTARGYTNQGAALAAAIMKDFEYYRDNYVEPEIIEGSLDIGRYFTIERVSSWFKYDRSAPLLFNSALFLGLFLVFYLIYIFTRKYHGFRTVYVLAFSYFFYYKAGGMFFVLLAVSCVFNYYLSDILHKSEKPRVRKNLVTLSTVVNLGVLAYYKYTNFLIDNINAVAGSDFSFQNIILPVGISFYTFQAISYTIDVYRKDVGPARGLLDFSFYLSYFPQLVAGPIVRAKEFLPQMYRELKLTKEEKGGAIFLIMVGLIKKAIISDYISLNFVDRVFGMPESYTAIENLLAAYGYAIQIYCDFSGYSDMAIGLAMLMGFKLPVNFRTPYKSASVTEFWRRWHISLSSWLRDYLYISLGGNRKGKIRTYVNLMLTMLIGGLWHGASWKFVMWGGLQGAALAIERMLKPIIKMPKNIFTRIIGVIITFHFISFAWIFFRAESFDTAMALIGQIGQVKFHADQWVSVLAVYKNVLIVLLAGFIMHFLPDRFVRWLQKGFVATPVVVKAMVIGLVFWLVYATASSDVQPFIYFQF